MTTILGPDVVPHDDPSRIIGRRTTYHGADHPYLWGRLVVIVSLRKAAFSPDQVAILESDAEIQRAGGVAAADRVEVSPWIADAGRPSFVTSDALATDLACLESLRKTGRTN